MNEGLTTLECLTYPPVSVGHTVTGRQGNSYEIREIQVKIPIPKNNKFPEGKDAHPQLRRQYPFQDKWGENETYIQITKSFNKFLKGHATGYLILIFLEAYEKPENPFILSQYTREKNFTSPTMSEPKKVIAAHFCRESQKPHALLEPKALAPQCETVSCAVDRTKHFM